MSLIHGFKDGENGYSERASIFIRMNGVLLSVPVLLGGNLDGAGHFGDLPDVCRGLRGLLPPALRCGMRLKRARSWISKPACLSDYSQGRLGTPRSRP